MITDKRIPTFITKLLPQSESLWRNFFIAGGFVVNPHLAMDVDLWIPQGRVTETLKRAHTFDFTTSSPADVYECVVSQTVDFGVVVVEEGTHPVHLLSSLDSIFTVLDDFDLSVHQVAEKLDGFTVLGPRYTYPQEEIEVIHYRTAETTLKRYRRLCARYGLNENESEIKRLEDASVVSGSTF